MVTDIADVVTTNSASGWMAEVEQDAATVRQLLQAKLATVPQSAAKVSGPRNEQDISFALWERAKRKVGVDFEQPKTVSEWRQEQNYEKEFMPLSACTDTNVQDDMLLLTTEIRPKNRYTDILAYKHSRV